MKKKKGLLIGAVVVSSLILASLIGFGIYLSIWNSNQYSVSLSLQGEPELTMEYGADFVDPGAAASVQGDKLDTQPQSIEVSVSGQVDTSRVGTYKIVYTARYEKSGLLGTKLVQGTLERVIHVVDTQKPVITLNAVDGSYTLPGHPYQEEGFSATDGYDGDLTAKVVCHAYEDRVVYEVMDSSGNTAREERTIRYDDPVAPELVLLGEREITITVEETYEEPGYTAQDNCDGDITARVEISGEVDTATIGTYILEYTVRDAWGNQAKAERTVIVEKKKMPPLPENPVGGVIYLTFDDGPSGYTSWLLDILDRYGVKASFFVVGTKNLSVLPRMVASGHTVAMHSNTHKYGQIYASEEAYFQDLYAIESKIAAQIGSAPKLLRFPGGSSNNVGDVSMRLLTEAVEAKGYKYFDWNVDSMDAGGASDSDEVFYNVCSSVARKRSSVVLMHDTKGYTVEAIERIIQWCLANGYTFLPLDMNSPGCHHTPRT